ncbi:circumsporozoite protein-like [Eriocheir sinensis]|uniref:circumsporozoite protein-like n=1 Tax=Eriocheir sinensis TaxID=95602 RepID=UPI0021C81567|nr:circumsporozoite protein-like [Eriocheir sinensis]XP_050718144.1 circumsporozoite protein-like [Eriocheir sinensis]XP_050718146.1 circumsporozoite protein-like [Eriocheir sinensis]
MTTYRKEGKEQHALLHPASKLQNEYWARTNCLLGFTVISILIGCVALAISILLLLQSFELAGLENAKVSELEMRVKYLERLTESLQPQEGNNIDQPFNMKGAPPAAPPAPPAAPQPQTPPPHVPQQPPPPPPRTQPIPDNHVGEVNEEEEESPIEKGTENEAPVEDTDIGIPRRPYPLPPLLPIDDDEDSDTGYEGSGDDCPQNPPRPICPITMQVCKTKERCPKYVCCR